MGTKRYLATVIHEGRLNKSWTVERSNMERARKCAMEEKKREGWAGRLYLRRDRTLDGGD
jgi:hypothetical protein